MPFDDWKEALAKMLAHAYREQLEAMDAYISDAEDAWREMYDDGLSPEEACSEELDAAAWAAA